MNKHSKWRSNMMKKGLSMMLVMSALLFAVGGCATRSDLMETEARQMAISTKADQASQDAQNAKVAADEALMRANEAIARAEAAEERAVERERIAEEKARQAEAIFQNSMRK
jgi:murein lipoprotein